MLFCVVAEGKLQCGVGYTGTLSGQEGLILPQWAFVCLTWRWALVCSPPPGSIGGHIMAYVDINCRHIWTYVAVGLLVVPFGRGDLKLPCGRLLPAWSEGGLWHAAYILS